MSKFTSAGDAQMVSLADVEDIISTVIIPDPARELLIKRLRASLAKPAERVTIGIGGDSNGPGTFVYLDNNWMITFRGTNRDKDAERYADGLRQELRDESDGK